MLGLLLHSRIVKHSEALQQESHTAWGSTILPLKSCATSVTGKRDVDVQVADFKTIVFRQQQLGFNAVRLPFTFSDLNLPPKSWTMPCTDDTASLKVNLTPMLATCNLLGPQLLAVAACHW